MNIPDIKRKTRMIIDMFFTSFSIKNCEIIVKNFIV